MYLLIKACGGECKGIPRVGRSVLFKYPPHAGYSFGSGCSIGPFTIFDVPVLGCLTLGDNVKLTAGVYISSVNKVIIDSNSLIAEWAAIRDAQHSFFEGTPIREQELITGEVFIGKDVWIGRCSSILMDSTINDGCIVGANSIVSKKVLVKNGVYVGAPVALKKTRVQR